VQTMYPGLWVNAGHGVNVGFIMGKSFIMLVLQRYVGPYGKRATKSALKAK
jgi:hypothetical protein